MIPGGCVACLGQEHFEWLACLTTRCHCFSIEIMLGRNIDLAKSWGMSVSYQARPFINQLMAKRLNMLTYYLQKKLHCFFCNLKLRRRKIWLSSQISGWTAPPQFKSETGIIFFFALNCKASQNGWTLLMFYLL